MESKKRGKKMNIHIFLLARRLMDRKYWVKTNKRSTPVRKNLAKGRDQWDDFRQGDRGGKGRK